MIVRCQFNEMLSIDVLKSLRHPKNPNKHPKEQIERLAQILKYQGIRHPIVVATSPRKVMTKGHGRLLAAIENGWHEFPVQYQEYESDEMLYADIVADNAIASWAELDLASINLEIPDLGPDFDIDQLGIEDFVLEPADKYGDQDADEVPQIRESSIQLGDLFQLGTHRILCGDATQKMDVERLMNGEKADMVFTDPPYGMNLDTDYSAIKGTSVMSKTLTAKKHELVIGDNIDYDPSFIFEVFGSVKEIFLWGADYYCQRIPSDGGWLVWDKTGGHDSLMNAGFASNFELCWSKQRHKRDLARITWKGVAGRAGEKTVHPTQKPVQLAEWFFERWGKDKTNIVDLYLGSGSTLIACEKTNRRCFGAEIDPQYCQVIIDRWEKFTGQKAVKLEKNTGEQLKNNAVQTRSIGKSKR